MIKIFCDKCGKEITKYGAYAVSIKAPDIMSCDDAYLCDLEYQICKDCTKKVSNYITANKAE